MLYCGNGACARVMHQPTQLHALRGGQLLGDGGEVGKQSLVGQQQAGTQAVVQAEGMLQTLV